jgi:hypothetical protein
MMETGLPEAGNFSEAYASESAGTKKAVPQSIESEGLGPCNFKSVSNRKSTIHAITATKS